ncbi:hypothetical protein YH62_24700 [Rhizobium sp. LC145]|nr:hypothetical protein YH62_24700 [Rhizobium sp. LC145]
MQRFAGEEFLRDLMLEFDAVIFGALHGSSFRNLVSRSISHPNLFTPRGALQPLDRIERRRAVRSAAF